MATEKRLIDANALLEHIRDRMYCTYPNLYPGMFKAKEIIKNFPVMDAVEVVRCADCMYCDPENKHCDHPMSTTLPIGRKSDDFCSYGERKGNG